ncbi:Irregular chiasm C-roughest protein [Pseudolycoriella hygida]|uniref:Irregular chiasm C-roughest protein n=1 Tax=Pseudolycoriella hygida TaxID=35572 RepID=A0A9Q0S0K2_9DIPT|nr:Irregular chiasm C-roughest protein [Pseudolycoriella hygida]
MENIPPTSAAFLEHLKRSIFQGALCWGSSTEIQMDLPNPTKWGWQKSESGTLNPFWTKKPEIGKVLKWLKYNCKKKCASKCCCMKADFILVGTKKISSFKMKGALFILLTTVLSVLAEQKFAVEPEDVSAVVGSHVTLPCKVISKHGMLQWTKDDFGLGTHRNLSAFERYSMIGNDEDGDFSLKIESVNLDDDAKFQCQVSPSEDFILVGTKKISSFKMKGALFILLTTVLSVLAEQKFAVEPEDVSAVVGSHVTLPCKVISKHGMLQWTKDDFGLGTHRNLSAFERYSMIGNDEDGDFSLKIESVNLDDDAKFQCQVSPSEGQPGIRSKFATLTVVIPPEPPIISHGEFYLATENQEFELECSSNGGKPAAELTWLDGSGNAITTGVRNIKEPMPDNRRFVSKSILKIKPQKEHHNTTLTCQSQNTADRNLKTAQVNVEVKYAPTVQLTIENSNEPNDGIREGDEAKFYCLADANPNVITYKWFVNEELVVGDYTTEMVNII